MDIFEDYLYKNKGKEVRALIDSSYNAYRPRGIDKKDKRYEMVNTPLTTNADLATYGDAVIKLCYCEILLDNVKELTIEKAKYESDEYLVKVVARHYDLLKYIRKDFENKDLPDSYDYEQYQSKDHNRCKYIATAVEAIVGAIYKENKDLNLIIELLKQWMKLDGNNA